MTNRDRRIQWMHLRIAGGYYPNAALLSKKFNISRRQAERDVSFMKKELGAPMEYSGERQGFFYYEEFALPVTVNSGNDVQESGLAPKMSQNTDLFSDSKAIQLQIPYTAELIIPDKLAAMELKSFMISSKPRRNYYVCEFQSTELFLGIIMSLDSDVQIISPKWLRDRAVSSAKKILENNKDE